MEKSLMAFINSICNEYNEYDLYNYLLSGFCNDAEPYSHSSKYDEIVDFLCDSAYDIEMNYYENKQEMPYDKAHKVLIDEIKEMKHKALALLRDA